MRYLSPKSCLLALSLAAAMGQVRADTVVDFTGAFQPSLWTALAVAGGSIDLSMAPASIGLVGSDDGSGPAAQEFTITAALGGVVSFAWTYQSLDTEPVWDQFGYLHNGLFNPLSSDFDGVSQTGTGSFSVAAGDAFGFSVQSFDSSNGAATAWVSSFQFVEAPPPVPEPPMAMLLALGLAVAGLRARTARQSISNAEAAGRAA